MPELKVLMPKEPGKQKRSVASSPASGAEYAGIGLQLAASVLIFLFIGQWLDERFGTEPWLLLAGVFIGAGAGFYSIYWQLVIKPRRAKEGE